MVTATEDIELELLLEAIFKKYGYDFRNYARSSLKRRVMQRLERSHLPNLSVMQHHVLTDPSFFGKLLLDMTINVTEMFRDPSFYLALREKVVPVLRTYPFFKIWHAGCATGEEVYSMAILLDEEGLLKNAMIYATDIDEVVLKKAREGIYELDRIKDYTKNYQKAGGSGSFSDYYTANHKAAILNGRLKKHIVFAQHNLVTDSIFGEMNLIICRNVLIYFDRDLQNRVIDLFQKSLVRRGILCLGSKETLNFSSHRKIFDDFDEKEKIYRKNK
jgi:chemotaxis protein methyltransferase CheR